MTEICQAIVAVAAGHPTGAFALGLAALAGLHAAVGMARSGRWYVLPVLFGLTALAGFLLNPFADAQTAVDLREKLAGGETIVQLSIAQFSLAAASLWLGLRITARGG
ncbi:MAG TPA: hypothetical protein EYH34_19205, partial [Planctomycetes bacterium]|nr:hypothetical protein [Planctomycetota bacterium]